VFSRKFRQSPRPRFSNKKFLVSADESLRFGWGTSFAELYGKPHSGIARQDHAFLGDHSRTALPRSPRNFSNALPLQQNRMERQDYSAFLLEPDKFSQVHSIDPPGKFGPVSEMSAKSGSATHYCRRVVGGGGAGPPVC
jgi:hypothetical protein